MNELQFRYWLNDNCFSKKMQSDIVSRLKKLEYEFGFLDMDEEYSRDGCKSVLLLFDKKGNNKEMEKINPPSLPVGKYQLSTYKYALSLYIEYLKSL